MGHMITSFDSFREGNRLEAKKVVVAKLIPSLNPTVNEASKQDPSVNPSVNLIERVGSDKNGYWKILHENFKKVEQ